jgi:hypothetical protein
MKSTVSIALAALMTLAIGCGPGPRHEDDDDDGDDTPDAGFNCTPSGATETSCTDGFDNDCDRLLDCEDTECVGTIDCPVETCEIETPSVTFPLPDGNCNDALPHDPGVTDAQMQAYLDTCGAYDGVMNLTGFPAGSRLEDTTKLLAICATMEHTYLRDMQMEAICPDGQKVILSKFQGQTGGEVFLGEPITEPCDFDPSCTPVPGVGYEYCWRVGVANQPLIDFANATLLHDIPAGDYQPSQPFTGFQGCTLNGPWTIRILDGWGIDNGVVFGTRMEFDPSLSDDCPIIE